MVHTPVHLLQLGSHQSLNNQQKCFKVPNPLTSESLMCHFTKWTFVLLYLQQTACNLCTQLSWLGANFKSRSSGCVLFGALNSTDYRSCPECVLWNVRAGAVHSHRCWKRATRAIHSLRVCASALALSTTDGAEIHHTCGSRAVTQIVTLSKKINF